MAFLAIACDARNDAPAKGASREGEWRALALFTLPHENNPRSLEGMLAREQQIARAKPTKVSSWVDVGETWVLLARDRSDPGFYVHAEACAELALALSPDNASALRLRIATSLNKHEFAKARDDARVLIAKDANDSDALGLLSDALLEMGDLDGAWKSVEAMLALDDALAARSRRAWIRFLRNDVKGALDDAAFALTDARATPEARAFVAVDAAMIAWWTGDAALAERMLTRALAERADFPPALVGQARVALAGGRPDDARVLLERAWTARPLVETGALLVEAQKLAGQGPSPSSSAPAGQAAAPPVGQASAPPVGQASAPPVGQASAPAPVDRLEQDVLAHARRTDPRGTALLLAERGVELDEAARIIDAELLVHGDVYTHDAAAAVYFARGDVERAKKHVDSALAHGTPDPRLWARAGLIRNDRALLEKALATGALDPVTKRRVIAALPR